MPRTSFITRAIQEVPGYAPIYELFRKYLENNYGSQGTVEDYLRSHAKLCVHFGRLPQLVTIPEYVNYCHDICKKEDASFSTYKLIRYAVVQYFEFINVTPPKAAVPRWHKPERIPETLNVSEVDALLKSTGPDLKAKAILTVMIGSGTRSAETLNLRLSDQDFERGFIHVHNGKGSKDRLVPFDAVERMVVAKYIREHSPSEYLFESRPGKPLTKYYLNKVLETALGSAGIKKRMSLHCLRHTFSSLLFASGVDAIRIQQYLGHKRLETTIRYLHTLGFGGGATNDGPLAILYSNAKK